MLSDSSGGAKRLIRPSVVMLALLAWLAAGAFGGMAQGTLSQVQENDAGAFLPESAESTQAQELLAKFQESESLPALVVLAPSDGGVLTEEQAAAAQAFAEGLPGRSVADDTLLDSLLAGPVVAIPSEDGEAILIPVPLDATVAGDLLADGTRVSTAAVQSIRTSIADDLASVGLAGWVTGPAGYVVDLVSAFGGIDGILLAVALVVVLVILVIVYRSPILPFTVIVTSVLALCLAALVIKPMAGAEWLQLNGQSQGILSILVIGAATDYSLLLVARYREELLRTEHPPSAMRAAVRGSLEPIAASAGTVIAGLLCLMFSDLSSNASLGPIAAIGIVASFLAALTFLPAVLLIGGRWSRAAFWPKVPHHEGAGSAGGSAAGSEHRGLWWRVAEVVTRRDRRTWVGAAIVLVALSAFLPTLRADGTGEAEVFLGEVEAVAGQEVLSRHFDVGQVQPIQIITPQTTADAVAEAVSAIAGISAVAPYTGTPAGGDGVPGMPEGDAAPVVLDGAMLLQAVTVAAPESRAAQDVAAQVREVAQDVAPGTLVGGAAAQNLDTQLTTASDLRTIVPVVLAVIAVMLMLLLRSVLAPLLLLAANVLSFAAAMGLSAIVFNHVLGFPGADATVPLFGFVFLIALGIDYSIFLMTRVREESLAHGTKDGVRRGLAVTGGVITSAGLVLAATFSALAVIPLLFLAQIAFIVAAGVLIDTFIVRSLLVPGLVHDVGRRVWWPRSSRYAA